ncbi:MAG: hypothetical protein IPK53_09800 [bacterium]|nr:hypothetical protein [bacterium]
MADLQALRSANRLHGRFADTRFELALHYDLTGGDACYAALAQQLSAPRSPLMPALRNWQAAALMLAALSKGARLQPALNK